MRLTIVQYAGDYREAWERFEHGGKATYLAQRYSVQYVEALADRLEQVAVVCALTDEAHDIVLPNRVRAIGAGLKPGFHPRELVPIVAATAPDRLSLTTPMIPLLQWAGRNRIRTIAPLADSFQRETLRTAVRHRRLAFYLNRPTVEWVGNHGISACLSLLEIGVKSEKIIPWDWPPSHRPSEHPPRRLSSAERLSLCYVGMVSESKGVGDLLRSLRHLKDAGRSANLTIVGRSADEGIKRLTKELGLTGEVHFAGLVPNEDVPAVMRNADVVVIPSRHEYPEGLPLTIYEALAAGTPIIASDHPMFRGALKHEQSALVFPAGDSKALACAIHRLAAEPDLYARLSSNSERAWQALQLPVTWGSLLDRWLSEEPADRQWLWDHRLTSGLYNEKVALRSKS